MDGISDVALKRTRSGDSHPPRIQKDGVNLNSARGVQAFREQNCSESVKKMADALYDIGRQGSIDLVRGLFEEDDILRPHSTLVGTKSPLHDLVSNVQELVLFFKERCEHKLLPEEYLLFQRGNLPEYNILEHELRDHEVASAMKEVTKSVEALRSWRGDNVICINPIRVKPFSKSTASLSAILEKCDDAQEKLFVARRSLLDPYFGRPVIVNFSKQKDKVKEERPRSGTRGRKKRK